MTLNSDFLFHSQHMNNSRMQIAKCPVIAHHTPCLWLFWKQPHLSEPPVYPNQLFVSHAVWIIEVLLYNMPFTLITRLLKVLLYKLC